jgi:hypothetical protein
MSLDATGAAAPTNPLGGAQSTEDRFESLWQGGAFDSQNPKEAAQLQAERAAPEPQAEPTKAAPVAPTAPEQQVDPAQAQQEEAPDYANVEDYLQKAQIAPESFYELPVTVKVDGKTSQVPLKEVLKSYQLEQHVQQKSIAVSEAQKAWEAEQTQAKQALTQNLQTAQNLNQLARQQLLAEFKDVDWNRLRLENPLEWSVRNQDFQQKANALDAQLSQIQQFQQAQAQQVQQAQAAQLPKERDRMLEARPEWRDDKQFSAARSEISAYAQKLGFNPAELGSIFDHRYMLVLHDAARYAALQANAPQAVKRVRAAPQQANPGARIQRDPKQVAATQAKERFTKSRGRDSDAAAAYFEHLAT